MGPWLEFSERDGRLHTEWNQVRGDKSSGNLAGARTGRMSAIKPNLMNVSTEFEYQPTNWPLLPMMRSYLLPEEGHAWLKRDFSSQEFRWAAHFEEGSLYRAYNENADLDVHAFVGGQIKEYVGLDLPRKPVKITGFQILYGGGKNAIAGQLGCSLDEAATLKAAYFKAMPDIETLIRATGNLGRRGDAIRTWGGRIYYTEPSIVKDGKRMDFSYKLINYLMQGSAADQTKESIIEWHENKVDGDVLMAAVHDEINISAPKGQTELSMARLKNAMNKDRADVPMRSEGYGGPNWQDILPWKEHA
jgi:DNA polymerase I-like protein with 3'-5' exonuclease and polymerase domains